jgi:HAD superfamily hydrolase (TIGR01662 family)
MAVNASPSGALPMPLRAVFFDLGETLIDETRMWREWAAYMDVPEQAFMAAFEEVIAEGEHHHRAFECLRPGFDPKAAQRQRVADGTRYLFRTSDLYPDARACLASLRQAGYFVGIAGNQSRDLLESILALGLDADIITTSEHLGFEKPSPKFYEALLSQTGFRPDQAAYVGDRVDNDILPARAVGMTTVFIERGPWGRIHAGRGDAACADIRISALSDLTAALAR